MTADFGTLWVGEKGALSCGSRGDGPVGGNRLGMEGRRPRETGGMVGTTRGGGPFVPTDRRPVLGGGISIRPTSLSSPDGDVGGSHGIGHKVPGNPADYRGGGGISMSPWRRQTDQMALADKTLASYNSKSCLLK